MFEFVFLTLFAWLLWAMILITPAVLAFVLFWKILDGGWGYGTKLGLWLLFGALFGLGVLRFVPAIEVIFAVVILSFILLLMALLALLVSLRERRSYTIQEGFLTTGIGLFLIMLCTLIYVISVYAIPWTLSPLGALEFYSPISYYLSIFFLIGLLGIVSNREDLAGRHKTYAGLAGVIFLINYLLNHYGPLFLRLFAVGAVLRGMSVEASGGMLFKYGIILIVSIGILGLVWKALLVMGLQDKKGKIILSAGFGIGLAAVLGVVGIINIALSETASGKDFAKAIYSSSWMPAVGALDIVATLLFCAAYALALLRWTRYGPELKPPKEGPRLVVGLPKPKPEMPKKKIRCKTCGTEFEVILTGKAIKVKCPSCGSRGKIKVS
ncbi:MAG: zinc ribbon domain-containing protein [Candidatus Thermoplasmatota archaeon]|nr:zinc ribbon domain-containing protein [Candidatus Thermoplasmatota archaeon]